MKLMRFYLAFLCFTIIFVSGFTSAQVQTEWIKQFTASPTGANVAKFVGIDTAGNVFIGGLAETNDFSDITVVKYSAEGDSLWSNVYEEGGTNNGDDISGLVVDSEGNPVVTGYTHPPENPSKMLITTIKYDGINGDRAWVNRYNNDDPNASDRAHGIAITSDDGVFITGQFWGGASANSGTGFDMIALSYGLNGGVSWVYNFPDSSATLGCAIGTAPSQTVYALGTYGWKQHQYLRIVPSFGSTVIYELPNTDWGISYYPIMTIDSTGNKIIASQVEQGLNPNNGNKLRLIKFAGGNEPVWSFLVDLPGSKVTRMMDLKTDLNGNIFLSGMYRNTGGYGRTFLKKYSPGGDTLWTISLPFNSDFPLPIDVDHDGNVYVSGNIVNCAAIKYDGNGQEVWRAGTEISGWTGNDILVDMNGNVYVTGERSGYTMQMSTIKFSQTQTDIDDAPVVPAEFNLHQNFPNPFNPSTTIRFSLPETETVTLTVYNSLGEEVAQLLNNCEMRAGMHEVNFSSAALPSGVYMYRLQAGDFSDAKKMAVVK